MIPFDPKKVVVQFDAYYPRWHVAVTYGPYQGGRGYLGEQLTREEAEARAKVIRAAPKLLDACRAMVKAADELMTEFVGKKRAANWGVINQAMVDAGRAIKEATNP